MLKRIKLIFYMKLEEDENIARLQRKLKKIVGIMICTRTTHQMKLRYFIF